MHAFTLTNKYVMQKGVAGRFKHPDSTGMVTVYGDDLYYLDYNMSLPRRARLLPPCRGLWLWPHPTTSRTGTARVTRRWPRPDGAERPNNGDDRFYVVDLAAGDGQDWKSRPRPSTQWRRCFSAVSGALADDC